MTTDSEWTDWIPHVAGDPCPILDARAGEYQLRFADGVDECEQFFDAVWWSNGADSWRGHNSPDLNITAYRLRKPSPDWKGIAEELAMALEKADEELKSITYRKTQWPRPQVDAALTRYREAIK